MSNENTEDRTGWYEFIMPGGSTTHIAYAHENGTVYLPEGEEVVSAQDFHLASASNRFWRLIREPKKVTTVEELDALGFQAVILDACDTPHVCERFRTDGKRAEWKPSGMDHLLESDDILFHGPATVLHSPAASK